jgi:hypothetical protein
MLVNHLFTMKVARIILFIYLFYHIYFHYDKVLRVCFNFHLVTPHKIIERTFVWNFTVVINCPYFMTTQNLSSTEYIFI